MSSYKATQTDISATATHTLAITEQIRDETNGILNPRLLYEANMTSYKATKQTYLLPRPRHAN